MSRPHEGRFAGFHPRARLHLPANMGDRVADAAAATLGSWRFIVVQTVLVGLWVALNVAAIALRWDPYPFVLLNLMFSVQAAYAGPIILLAGNRQAAKDRARDDLEAEEVRVLYEINQRQLSILEALHPGERTS